MFLDLNWLQPECVSVDLAQCCRVFGWHRCYHGSAAGETAESSSKVFGWGPELAKLLRDSKEPADRAAAICWESQFAFNGCIWPIVGDTQCRALGG